MLRRETKAGEGDLNTGRACRQWGNITWLPWCGLLSKDQKEVREYRGEVCGKSFLEKGTSVQRPWGKRTCAVRREQEARVARQKEPGADSQRGDMK